MYHCKKQFMVAKMGSFLGQSNKSYAWYVNNSNLSSVRQAASCCLLPRYIFQTRFFWYSD
jgi:hypothetical protein